MIEAPADPAIHLQKPELWVSALYSRLADSLSYYIARHTRMFRLHCMQHGCKAPRIHSSQDPHTWYRLAPACMFPLSLDARARRRQAAWVCTCEAAAWCALFIIPTLPRRTRVTAI